MTDIERVNECSGCYTAELLDERDNLAMLVRRLVRVVTRHDNGNTVANQALDYLKRKELLGSPIREVV